MQYAHSARGRAASFGWRHARMAIEYGPLSLYRYDDTLGGFSYDLLRQLASGADCI